MDKKVDGNIPRQTYHRMHMTKVFGACMLQTVKEPSGRNLQPFVNRAAATSRQRRTLTAMAGANGSAATDPKLTALREAMSAANGGQGVQAYIVPSEDPHMVRHNDSGSPAH